MRRNESLRSRPVVTGAEHRHRQRGEQQCWRAEFVWNALRMDGV